VTRRRENCPTCTVIIPTFTAVDVDAYWSGLSRLERLRSRVGVWREQAVEMVPGHAARAERRILQESACPDCGELHHQVFMVHDAVWASTGLTDDAGWFCLPCFERRLGRSVEEGDLCDVPANDWL
jgi:hypothetical protein